MRAGIQKIFDEFEALDEFFALGLAVGFLQVRAHAGLVLGEVDFQQYRLDRFGADAGDQAVIRVFVLVVVEFVFRDELVYLEGGGAGVDDDVGLEIEDFFDVLQREVQHGRDAAGQRF